jgi:predicted ArsR family transcriptional regulator
MIRFPEGNEPDPVSLEDKYRKGVPILLQQIRRFYEELARTQGRKGLDHIRRVSSGYGEALLERARKHVRENDVESVGLYVVRIFNNIDVEGELVEFGPDRVTIRCHECPYPFASPEVCEAHTTMEQVIVEGLGDDLAYTVEYSIPRGDPYCDHVVSRKKKDM